MEPVTFNSSGLQIQGNLYTSEKAGEVAVVFCHGAFEFQENWSEYACRLAEGGLIAFTFDFAGHGASQGLRSLVDLRAWAYNLREALNELGRRGYRRFALVGWGSGGSAALLAAAHDARIACAVCLATPVFLQPSLSDRLVYGLGSVLGRAKKALLKKPLTLSRLNELENMRLLADAEANAAYMSGARVRANYAAIPLPESLNSVWVDISGAIEKVQVPVLVLHGGEDAILPQAQSERLYALLTGEKKLEIVPGSGHALHLDRQRELVYRLIADWVGKYLKA